MNYTFQNTKKFQGLRVFVKYVENDREVEKLAPLVTVAKNGIILSLQTSKPIPFSAILSLYDKKIHLHKPGVYALKIDKLTTDIVEKIISNKTFSSIRTRKKSYSLVGNKVICKRSFDFELIVYKWLGERTSPIKICPIALIVRGGKSLLLTITQGRFCLINKSYTIIFEEKTFSDILNWISEANDLLAQEVSVKKPLTGFAEIASLID